MRKDSQPGKSAHKQENLGQYAGDCGTGESLFSSIENPTGEASDERIGQQKSAGWTQQLGQATRSRGIKYRHAHEAFGEVKSERRECTTWAEREPYKQDAKVLQG